MAYFDGAADLEHLRDSGFVERFLKVLKKLGLVVNNRHTDKQTYMNGGLRRCGQRARLFVYLV